MSLEFVRNYLSVFRGRDDVFATAFPKGDGKVGYTPVPEPLTEQRLLRHLRGEELLGVYTLRPGDTTRFFCADFDAPKVELEDGSKVEIADPFPVAWEAATEQAARFEAVGLQVYLEASRSGKGVHVWGFFSEDVPASAVRQALVPLLIDEDFMDRLYPVQVALTDKKPWGNLLALPYFGMLAAEGFESPLGLGAVNGGSTFRNRDTLEPIAAPDLLLDVFYNNGFVIEELAEKAVTAARTAPAGSPAARAVLAGASVIGIPDTALRPPRPISGVLKLVSEFGCSFMRHAYHKRKGLGNPEWYAALGQLTCFEHGRDAAHVFSMGDPRYDPAVVDEAYDRALQNPPVGCAYVHQHFPKLACQGCPMKAPYRTAEKTILQLTKGSHTPMVKSTYRDTLTRIKARRAGALKNGIKWLTAGMDRVTRLRKKELTVIGALPSIGKTALLVDATINVARSGTVVFVASAETGTESLEERLIARVAKVDSKALRNERMDDYGNAMPLTDDEMRRVEAAVAELETLPIYIHYSACQPEHLLALIEDTLLRHRIPLDADYVLFMDYLQFGATDDGGKVQQTEYQLLSRLVAEFKWMAKITEHPVVVFSQVRRDNEGDEAPSINWFKGTGRIEADADVAIILTGQRTPGAFAKRVLTFVKQREGDAGVALKLLLHQIYCYFEPLDGPGVAGGTDAPAGDLFAHTPDPTAAATHNATPSPATRSR